jgi:hypothetical protein
MPLDVVTVRQQKEQFVSDQKSTSVNAVSLDRWESLKREYFWRTHRKAPTAAPDATVADPNAE